jgi:hypothetical protein
MHSERASRRRHPRCLSSLLFRDKEMPQSRSPDGRVLSRQEPSVFRGRQDRSGEARMLHARHSRASRYEPAIPGIFIDPSDAFTVQFPTFGASVESFGNPICLEAPLVFSRLQGSPLIDRFRECLWVSLRRSGPRFTSKSKAADWR